MNKLTFKIGMTAPEVMEQITLLNRDIKALLFKIYTPRLNLKEEFNINPSVDRLTFCSPSDLEEKFWLTRDKVTTANLHKIIQSLKINQVIGVTSKVKVFSRSNLVHIPMMDFDCEINRVNLYKINEFFKKINQTRGVILRTDRSYHFYGNNLLNQREWFKFLGYCLLFEGFVDSRYVGHRIINNYACLRISKGGLRKTIPKVVLIL